MFDSGELSSFIIILRAADKGGSNFFDFARVKSGLSVTKLANGYSMNIDYLNGLYYVVVLFTSYYFGETTKGCFWLDQEFSPE